MFVVVVKAISVSCGTESAAFVCKLQLFRSSVLSSVGALAPRFYLLRVPFGIFALRLFDFDESAVSFDCLSTASSLVHSGAIMLCLSGAVTDMFWVNMALCFCLVFLCLGLSELVVLVFRPHHLRSRQTLEFSLWTEFVLGFQPLSDRARNSAG